MNNSPNRSKITRRVLFTIAAYIAAILVGCMLIWMIPVAINIPTMQKLVKTKAENLLDVYKADNTLLYGMEFLLVNGYGNCIFRDSSFLLDEAVSNFEQLGLEIMNGPDVAYPMILTSDNGVGEAKRVFGVVCGTTVTTRNGYTFAAILLRDFADLTTIMWVYVGIFTFTYIIGVIFVIYIYKKDKSLNMLRRDLIANMSHELKTPITSISVIAEAWHDGMIRDEESQSFYSSRILKESKRLEHLVLDILELSKLQSNMVQLNRSRIYADGLFPPIIDRYSMMCGDFNLSLDHSGVDYSEDYYLYTDIERISTVMNILLDNAVKFTPAGNTIYLSSVRGQDKLTVCVRDSGPGIKPADLPRIFDRFYKADVAHNTAGSGLGLAIAKELIQLLDEKIWVESTYGEGAAFYFTIDLRGE